MIDRISASSRAVPCVVVLVAALCGASAFAQDLPFIPGVTPPSNAATNAVPPAPVEPSPVEPEFASPRATIRTFYEAFNATESESGQDPIRMAVRCLDLTALPQPLWGEKGPELAIHLKSIMDRIEYIDPETVPDEPNGLPWVFYSSPQGEISIGRRKSGQWLFTKATIASIPSLMREFENHAPVTQAQEEPRLETRYQILRQYIPGALRRKGFLLEHWQWIILVGGAIVGVLIWRTIAWLLTQSLGRLVRRRWDSLTEADVYRGFSPVGLLVMALLWLSGLSWLGLPLWMNTIVLVAMRFMAVIAIVWIAFALVEMVMLSLRERASKADSTIDVLLVPLVRTSARIVITIAAIAVFAENFNVEITGLLAGLGLGGVAIALAAKDTFGNFFGSLTVILDKPFRAGDWVKIGAVEGKVEEVGLRSTRIRTFDDSLVTMPNLVLTATAVENLGLRRWRRWKTMIVIGHRTPPDKIEAFCSGILDLVSARPSTLRQDNRTAAINAFTNTGIEIVLVVFFDAEDTPTENRLRHEFGIEILRLAERLGIEFAGGSQTVVVMPNEEATDDGKDAKTRESLV